jgi:hypothetical protein
MCEICEAVNEYQKASEDLKFRLQQHGHALRMNEAVEASTASSMAVDALHRLLMAQRRIVDIALKLDSGVKLDEIMKGKPLH